MPCKLILWHVKFGILIFHCLVWKISKEHMEIRQCRLFNFPSQTILGCCLLHN